ncbi:F-box/LRR-repeat protein At5g02910 [Linum perenne]
MPSLRLPSLTSLLFYSSMATETTNKRIKSATDDTEGRDLISELPEEIIHQVLRHIASPAKAARTTALSRRWRSVWSCYPVLKFRHSDLPRPTVDKRLENFKKFVEASMERGTFNEEETGDNTINPTNIDHLKYCTVMSNLKIYKRALLEALFKVCRPNHLTLIHMHKNSERFFRGLLSLMQQKGGADESLMWLNGLKDVKIITRDVDVEIEEEEEELMMGCLKCKTKNQLCLELTWG